MASFFDRWHFHDDAPLSSSPDVNLNDEDTFHRRHMAQRLASLIGKKPLSQSQVQAGSSFTLAVCAPWGEGKTSLKNLTLRFLQDYKPCPDIVHFNPRQWSSEAAIISDFFVQLARGVEQQKGKKAKAGGQTVRSIGNLLSYGQKAASAGAVATVVVPGMQPAAAGLGAAGAGFGAASEIAKTQADSQDKAAEKLQSLSLSELQTKAAEQLRSLEKPVVVFVDDLDRLTGPEIALVFQLLKFNADFPNVVYVLLADRVILERGLDTLFPGEGRRYLEKFVQLSLELPQPPADALSQGFYEALSPVFTELSSVAPDLRNQIRAAYKDVFFPYLSTMRRVQLYVNALHFSLPLGKDARKDIWEIFPFDVLLLELLRAHESAVYREIRNSREWLTSVFAPVGATRMVFDIQKDKITNNNHWSPEEKEQRVAQLFEQHKPIELSFLEKLLAVADNPSATEKVLKLLFPNLELLFQQKSKIGQIITGHRPSGTKWDVERRLCSPRRFDRYFSAVVSGATLRQDERDLLASQRANRNEFVTTIRELSRNNRTDDVLTELENIAERTLSAQEVEPFITALMDWGDEIPFVMLTPSSIPPRILRLCGLVTFSVGKTVSLQEAVNVFERACANTTGFYVPLVCAQNNLSIGEQGMGAYFALELTQFSLQERQQVNDRLMAQLGRAKDDLWKKFDAMIAGTINDFLPLEKRSTFGSLLWQWVLRDAPRPRGALDDSPEEESQAPAPWPSREAARDWVANLIAAPEGFARFAQMSAAPADSIWGDEAPYPNATQLFRTDVIEQTTSVENLLQVGETLDFSALNERERKWAGTLLDAVRSKVEGKYEAIPYFLLGDSTFV